jgi:hypothetical protein
MDVNSSIDQTFFRDNKYVDRFISMLTPQLSYPLIDTTSATVSMTSRASGFITLSKDNINCLVKGLNDFILIVITKISRRRTRTKEK